MTVSLSAINVQRAGLGHSAPRATLATYFVVWQQRRVLARLDISRLNDLGISQAEAKAEAARPFWDLLCVPRG